MSDAILEIIKLGSVGLIAGLFSSFLSNRDHRQRKWWEMRVSAYQNAIESLSDIVYYYDKHLNAAMENREPSMELNAILNEQWERSFPKVRKYADTGAFLFSKEANEALRDFMKDEDEHAYEGYLNNNLKRSKICLSILIKCSKSDLKLESNF